MQIDLQKRSAKMHEEMQKIRTDIVHPFTKSSFDFGAEKLYASFDMDVLKMSKDEPMDLSTGFKIKPLVKPIAEVDLSKFNSYYIMI